MRGISKSLTSSSCAKSSTRRSSVFRSPPLEGAYPYVWVDATHVKACQKGHVTSVAVVIAVGVKAQNGEREVFGFDVGQAARTALSGAPPCVLWSPEGFRERSS
jgi:putative transposase